MQGVETKMPSAAHKEASGAIGYRLRVREFARL